MRVLQPSSSFDGSRILNSPTDRLTLSPKETDIMQANGETAVRSSISISLQLQTLQEIREFCDILSTTDMIPKGYKGKPDDILVAILHGQEVGLPHLQALQSIAVVNGIPSIYGDAALAMVRASGKLEDFDEWIEVDGARQEGPFPILKDADENKKIVAFCKSKRHGMSRERITTYSVDDAKRAKLWEKKGANGYETPWCTVPQRMLMWRARGWNLRDQFGDVLKGLAIYEEAMDIETTRGVDGTYRPVAVQAIEQSRESKANEEALEKGKEALEREQREKSLPNTNRQEELAKQQEQAKEKPPTDSKTVPMTVTRACDLLEMAQSPAEIAKVMNEWERVESTQPERKKVIDNKDQAMKRLAAASKKK